MLGFLQDLIELFKNNGISTAWVGASIFVVIIIIPAISVIISLSKLRSERQKILLSERAAKQDYQRLSIEDINKELTDLYLPLRYYLIQSKMLYDTFALDEKAYFERKRLRFNTLKYLCQGGKFNEKDELILQEIINIGEKQNSIIEEKNWTADGDALSTLLSKYSAHLKILKLVHSNKCMREEEIYDEYTFPIELPGAIESQIFRLMNDKSILMSDKDNKINSSINIQKYTKDALHYYRSTIEIPPGRDIVNFKSRIKKGGLVCDLGCGSGRDSRYFIQNGFRVYSTEPSAQLASLARSYPFIFVKEESLIDMNYPSKFDAVWCSAVLQHIEAEDLEIAIKNLVLMLNKRGILYISYRATATRLEIIESKMTLHKTDRITEILKYQKMDILEFEESVSTKDKKSKFHSILARKREP